jgi:hypothetical protein
MYVSDQIITEALQADRRIERMAMLKAVALKSEQ